MFRHSGILSTMDTRDFLSDKYTVRFEKLLSNGSCLAHADGMALFVPFGIPGETAEVRITDQKKGYLTGEIIGISDYSPDRIHPTCPLFGRCGGCSLQHIKYERQLELKKEMLTEALKRTGHIDFSDIKVIPSEPYGYRIRTQFHPAPDGNPGFMSGATNNVLQVKSCPVCSEEINGMLEGGSKLKLRERTVFFAPDKKVFSPALGNGTEDITIRLKGKDIRTNSLCFFQSNRSVFEKMLETLESMVKGGDIWLDLYSGIGLPGIFFTDRYRELFFVEENPFSARYGAANTAGTGQCRFFNMKTEAWLKSPKKKIKPDTIFLDPPRTGITDKVADYLSGSDAKEIFYLSCNFTTLARDLGKLTRESYRIDTIHLFDFYPQTPDMECLVHLYKN